MQNSLRVVLFLLALYAALVFKAQAQDVFNPVAQGRRGVTASGGIQYSSGTTNSLRSSSSYYSDDILTIGGDFGIGVVKFISEGIRLDIGLNAGTNFNRYASNSTTLFPIASSTTLTNLNNNSTFGPYIRLVKYVKIFNLNRWFYTFGTRVGIGVGFTNYALGDEIILIQKTNSWYANMNATALLGLAYFPTKRIGLDAFVNLATVSYMYQSSKTKYEGAPIAELPEAKSSNLYAILFSGFSSGAVGVSFTYYLK